MSVADRPDREAATPPAPTDTPSDQELEAAVEEASRLDADALSVPDQFQPAPEQGERERPEALAVLFSLRDWCREAEQEERGRGDQELEAAVEEASRLDADALSVPDQFQPAPEQGERERPEALAVLFSLRDWCREAEQEERGRGDQELEAAVEEASRLDADALSVPDQFQPAPEQGERERPEALAVLFSLRDWCREAEQEERGRGGERERGRAEAYHVVAGATAWDEADRLAATTSPPDQQETQRGERPGLAEAARAAIEAIDATFDHLSSSGLMEEGGGLPLYEQTKSLAAARVRLAGALLPDQQDVEDTDDPCACGHVRHEHRYGPDPECGPETLGCAQRGCGCEGFELEPNSEGGADRG